MTRTVILGNSGSGKTTLARALAAEGRGTVVLSLDLVAFVEGTPERRPLEDSIADIERFVAEHDAWVIEGCFGDLAQAALRHADELVFLNPGTEACVAHCRARPWEPDKFATSADQDALLEGLLAWVRQYDDRDDEFGLTRHRAVFDAYPGTKREVTDARQYAPDIR